MPNGRLRATLHANGYTDASFADELGVDPKTVQRWITHDRTPHRTTAYKAAKLLDVPAVWLWPALDSSSTGQVVSEVEDYLKGLSLIAAPASCAIVIK